MIDDETTIAAMFEKARHATYIVSQVCFDPAVTAQWIEDVWARGTRLPVYVGVPGAVSRAKLLAGLDADRDRRLAALPAQERQLRGPLPARRLQPRRAGRRPRAGARGEKVAGFHVFTFNDVEDTERWRRQRLASAPPATIPGS